MIVRNRSAHSQARNRNEEGVALIYAVFGAMMAAGMVTVMFATAGNASRKEDLHRDVVQARYLAEGGAEVARKSLANAVANWETPPTNGVVDISGTEVEYTIVKVGPTRTVVDSSGIQTLSDTFEITASASADGRNAVTHNVVTTESTPVFQFAVFYTQDLEVLPGPSMTLGGRVHSNGNMHLGSGGTLTLDTNYVHAVGDIYRQAKNDMATGGTVRIRKWVENPYDPSEPVLYEQMNSYAQMADLGIDTISGFDGNFNTGYDHEGDGSFDGDRDWMPFAAGVLDLWGEPDDYSGGSGHTVLTGKHDLLAASAPDIGSVAMYEESDSGDYVLNESTGKFEYLGAGLGTHNPGYFHGNAGLSIVMDADGLDFQVLGPAGAINDENGVSYKQLLINSGAILATGIPDMRQSDSVNEETPVLQIDLAALGTAGLFPDNGLLYTAHYGMGEGVEAKGVLLTNGTELSSKLTVACEGAVYVHGDFNTVDKKGAAVIGDSVNLLSNAWDGTKSAGELPDATETTFNCAFITGNYVTEPGRYNGGIENLPRFHEGWSGVPCNITGSFVNPWDSAFATADWAYGSDRYKAPLRQWAYDSDFNTVTNLPPFTPMVVNSHQVVTW